jgi:hypothetical protein
MLYRVREGRQYRYSLFHLTDADRSRAGLSALCPVQAGGPDGAVDCHGDAGALW